MRVLIVHAHPEPKSMNGALTATARRVLAEEGHEVTVSDLYEMGWDPRSGRNNFTTVSNPDYFKQQMEELHAVEQRGFAAEIQTELDKVSSADALIFQFPLWWFGLPAILKGWVDRVFAMGITYGGGRWYDRGVFTGRRAMLSLTTGGPETMYGPDSLNGDINMLLYPIQHGILRFTGFDVLPPFVAWSAARVGDEVRASYLERYAERVRSLWDTPPIEFPRLDDYDAETFTLKRADEVALAE